MADAAFAELQNKLIQSNGSLKQAAQQIRITQTQQARATLVAQEVDKLPDDTICYENIGRAYFSKPKVAIVAGQRAQMQDCDQQIQDLKRVSETAARDIRGVETEIKEFLKDNRDFAQRFLSQAAA